MDISKSDYNLLETLVDNFYLSEAVSLAKKLGLSAYAKEEDTESHYRIYTEDGEALLEADYSKGWPGWYKFDGQLTSPSCRI